MAVSFLALILVSLLATFLFRTLRINPRFDIGNALPVCLQSLDVSNSITNNTITDAIAYSISQEKLQEPRLSFIVSILMAENEASFTQNSIVTGINVVTFSYARSYEFIDFGIFSPFPYISSEASRNYIFLRNPR